MKDLTIENRVKVSVIIPNYNHGKYLKERIESIVNQSYQNFELIILDDCSTDNSIEIISAYENHPKVSLLLVNNENSGSPFKQWVKGIELAKGEFIWFAESDDLAAPEFLSKSIEIMDSDELIAFAYCDSYLIDENGTIIGKSSTHKNEFFKTSHWSENHIVENEEEVLKYMFFKTTINNASAVLFKKSFMNKDAFLNRLALFKNAGDIFTFMVLSVNSKIAYLKEPLNYYRQHEQNITKINQKKGILFEERFKCYTYVISILNKNTFNEIKLNMLRKSCNYVLLKNGFGVMEFGNLVELKRFLKQVYVSGIFSQFKTRLLIFLFTFYRFNFFKFKEFSKMRIKRICSDWQ